MYHTCKPFYLISDIYIFYFYVTYYYCVANWGKTQITLLSNNTAARQERGAPSDWKSKVIHEINIQPTKSSFCEEQRFIAHDNWPLDLLLDPRKCEWTSLEWPEKASFGFPTIYGIATSLPLVIGLDIKTGFENTEVSSSVGCKCRCEVKVGE